MENVPRPESVRLLQSFFNWITMTEKKKKKRRNNRKPPLIIVELQGFWSKSRSRIGGKKPHYSKTNTFASVGVEKYMYNFIFYLFFSKSSTIRLPVLSTSIYAAVNYITIHNRQVQKKKKKIN